MSLVLPESLILRSNIDYVRDLLLTQTALTANGTEIVPTSQLPSDNRYFWYQRSQ